MINKKEEWEKFGYVWTKRKDSPKIPSIKELKIHQANFRSVFKNKKNLNWLVLGSTPELRDLGLRLGCHVTYVDQSLDMITKMNKLVSIKKRDKEIMVKSSWLNAPLLENHYHFIVGDVTLNNLDYPGYKKMFLVMQRFLAKGGYISLKEAVIPDDFQRNTFEQNLAICHQGKMSLNDLYLRCRFITWLDQCYNKNTKQNKPRAIFANFRQLRKKKIITAKEFQKLYKNYNLISHTILTKTEFLKRLKKHFKLVSIKQADSDRYDFYPLKIFLAKVKK